MAKILVSGGAGYIGSHTIVDLIQNGFEVVSVDNLSRGNESVFAGIEKITGVRVKNYVTDLCDIEATRRVFESEKDIVGMIHFAAYKMVNESVDHPTLYYRNNIDSLLNVLDCLQDFDIQNFVFSSSCSVYGNAPQLPVNEDTPMRLPESPYAATKQMGEQIIQDFSQKSHTRSMMLRYFNPVGAHPSALIGELPYTKPSNLIPSITQTAAAWLPKMYVWGTDYATRDGSCVRDYIHVMDIAHAHTLALRHLQNQSITPSVEILNVGSGTGVTVLEAIAAFERVSAQKLSFELGPRRPGDVEAIFSDPHRIQQRLGWTPQYSLDEMLDTAWRWQQQLGLTPPSR